MRLIDVDELIKFIENRYEITWEDDYEGGIKDACVDILVKISTMPTIEPERKRGKWIIFPPCFEEICMCSNCKTKFKEAYQHRDTCPSCGAKMER